MALSKPIWNGALEAEYRGRPTEEGYHWRLANGKLEYVVEAPEGDVPAKPKRVWDEKLGKLVTEAGSKPAASLDLSLPFTVTFTCWA